MTTYYTEDHEWITVDVDVATVGITKYAAEQLGDVVFVGDIDQPGQPPVPLPVRELEIAAILHQAGGVAGEGSVPVVKLPVLEKIQQMKMAVPVRLSLHGLTGGQTDSSE